MKTRVISAIIGAALLIAILALGRPFLRIAVILLAILAVYELLTAVKLADRKPLLAISLGAAAFMTTLATDSLIMFLPSLYVWLAAVLFYFLLNRQTTSVKDVATAFLLTAYPCFLFGHLVQIHDMKNGEILIWSVFVCAFLTDTCAMFGGKFFGKHKLCPKLSPKKTVEGAICGIIGCIISVIIFCVVCEKSVGLVPNYVHATLIAFGASVVSQMGDLVASCIKREFGIKDYGNIMPGHGGVMDRFDSVLFVSPFMCYALILFPMFS